MHGYWSNQFYKLQIFPKKVKEEEERSRVNIVQNTNNDNSKRNLYSEEDNYHFFDIKSEYMLHWIWYTIIVGCIGKSREVMLPDKIFRSFSHNSAIEFIHTMVSKMPLERIHDGIIVYLVMVNLTFGRKSSMEFSWCRANLSNPDIRRKNAVQSHMNFFQVVIVKWCKKMCNLQSL